jgi:protein-histidine pros-kinase
MLPFSAPAAHGEGEAVGITAKFNLILVTVLGAGFVAIGLTTHRTLYDNAYHEVLGQAGLMMDSAMAVRGYTFDEIVPLLTSDIEESFLPQIVPAYAATQSFKRLHENNPDYVYKEATLNPTNPRDRAVDWETDIISMFQNQPQLKEFTGERETPGGRSLYLSRPILVSDEACLTCHSTPEVAPRTMLQRYGNANGFGWGMNKVVGAQIVSVPMNVPISKAQATFHLLMAVLAIIFIAVLLLINLLLKLTVITPIQKMSHTANEVSQGKVGAPEFKTRGKDEIAVLAVSFNRMRRSLDKAMAMLDSGRS